MDLESSQNQMLQKPKNRQFIRGLVLFITALLVFGIIRLPADIVQVVLTKKFPQFEFIEPRGSLWRGQINIQAKSLPELHLNWDFSAYSLLQFAPEITWSLQNKSHSAQGKLSVAPSRISLYQFQARLDMTAFNNLDIVNSGILNITNGNLNWPLLSITEIDWFKPEQVEADIIISSVKAQLEGLFSISLPEIEGRLYRVADGIELSFYSDSKKELLVQLMLSHNMNIHIKILRRLLDISNIPWIFKSTPDSIIYEKTLPVEDLHDYL